MLKYIIKRLLWMIPVILGVLIIVFILSEITPGDPVDNIVGTDATVYTTDCSTPCHWISMLPPVAATSSSREGSQIALPVALIQ